MRTRTFAWLIAAGMACYLLFTGARAWALIESGDPVPIALGLSVLVLPLIGVWVLWRELSFGVRMQRMGRELDSEGALPIDDLPRTPSGRIERDAADARFVEYQHAVERNPEDWRAWYRLGVGYDDARDRKRARAAMRTADRLYRATLSP